jgi:hypothetical protein
MADNVVDHAKVHLLAQSRFNRSYCAFWANEVQPCPEEKGWELLDVFRNQVEVFVFRYGRGDLGIKQAAWEVFRLGLVGRAPYSFQIEMALESASKRCFLYRVLTGEDDVASWTPAEQDELSFAHVGGDW